MKKAYQEIGLISAVKYIFFTFALVVFKVLLFPPCRVFFLRFFRAKIGKNCILHNISFFNLYRGNFSHFIVGNNCFIGDESIFDMADKIILEDHVTLAERVMVLTHMNVGFYDHPLQKYFPKFQKPVIFKTGCFVGCNVTILPGTVIGECSLIAAGSVVTRDVPPYSVAGGVPATVIRRLEKYGS